MRSYHTDILEKTIRVCINIHIGTNEALSWFSHQKENSSQAAFVAGLGRWITKINEQKYIGLTE